MSLSDIGTIVALILSVGTSIAGVLAWLANRRRREAEVVGQELDNEGKEIDNVGRRIDTIIRLGKRLDELEIQRQEDDKRINDLRNELRIANERITTLEMEYAALHRDHRALQREHNVYKRGVKILVNQLRRHNITPEWTPPGEEG